VEEIKLSLPPSRIAAAPDGTMVLTMVSSNAFWRLSTAFNLKQVATAPTSNPTQTRFITTAPDGSVLLSSNDNKQVLVYTGQGGLRGTLTLPAPMLVFDMVVDAMGIGWLGSSTTNQVIRVTNIQGLSPPAMQAITLPTPATNSWGLALAPDGTIGIAGTPSVFIRLSATGGVLQNLALPVVMQDLAFVDDGTIWFLSKAISGNNVFKIPPGTGVAQPVLALAPAFTQVAIVNTPKGILFGTPGGGLTLMKADGSQQGVPLPGGAVVSSLAVNVGDGRVWATDSMASRLLVVTLP